MHLVRRLDMTDQTPKHMQAEDEHHFGKKSASQTEKKGTYNHPW